MWILFAGGGRQSLFQAIGWTLVHSLWLGMVAAAWVGILFLLTPRSKALLRYNLLGLILCCFLVSTAVVFCIVWHQHASAVKADAGYLVQKDNPLVPESNGPLLHVGAAGNGSNVMESLTHFITDHAAWIVCVWLAFFLVRFAGIFRGLQYIKSIRKRGAYPLSAVWQQKFECLQERMGIRGLVVCMESELVKIPLVVGYLKPVILLPLGLVNHLPCDQVEAILLHELAHVRRKDFLINLAVGWVEALFFFNPAITWISRLLREEREACCDDVVMGCAVQPRTYVEALVSFQEYALDTHPAAVAFGSGQRPLFYRARRLLTSENKKLNIMEKIILLVSVAALTAFGWVSNRTPGRPALPATHIDRIAVSVTPEIHQDVSQLLDTVPGKKSNEYDEAIVADKMTVHIESDGKVHRADISANSRNGKTRYRIRKEEGQVTELHVNDRLIPPSAYPQYQPVLMQVDELLAAMQDNHQDHADLDRRVEKARIESEILQQYSREQQRLAEHEQQMARQKAQMEKTWMEEHKLMEQREHLLQLKDSLRHLEENQLHLRSSLLHQNQHSNEEVQAILSDLLSNAVPMDNDKVSFSLSADELVVDGKKQSAGLHRQLKEKYIHKQGDRIQYMHQGNSTTININRE